MASAAPAIYPRILVSNGACPVDVQMRNGLWTTWLRRAPATAWARTVEAVRAARDDPATRSALLEAMRSLPWVLRTRQTIPPAIEEGLARLERG